MADLMSRLWLRFAEFGRPTDPRLSEWPSYRDDSRQYARLDMPPAIGNNWRAGEVSFVAANAVA